MILLRKNAINQFGITAKETATVSNLNYLFRFLNTQSRKEYLTYLIKVNTTSLRYDLFNIDLPNDLNLPTGDYVYEVYESSNLDLDYQDKNLLEIGKMEVLKEFPSVKTFVNNTIDTINYEQ